jgi:hypothetical protein
MTMLAFDEAGHAALGSLYPERPGIVPHRLLSHPLLTLEALVGLAGRLRPEHVEHNVGRLPIGIDPADIPQTGMTPAEMIRGIEQAGAWMVLKFIENDPAYKGLLDACLAEIEEVVAPLTGAMLKKEGFIFVSSPGSVTPFHFDPEHNILLQVRGRKTMTVFPADDEEVAPGALHEAFHQGAHRNLPYEERFAGKGTPFTISAGEAIYVPVKSPHWVKNGDAPSISLSITWRSEWSFREEEARGWNAVLRKAGIDPAAPKRFPEANRAKSLAYRALRKGRSLIR